jgi:hypothetical protein
MNDETPRALWITRDNLLPALAGLAEAVNNGGEDGGCVLVDPELIEEIRTEFQDLRRAIDFQDNNGSIRHLYRIGALLTAIPEIPASAEKGAA